MRRLPFLILFFQFCVANSFSQLPQDSTVKQLPGSLTNQDTVTAPVTPSKEISKAPVVDSGWLAFGEVNPASASFLQEVLKRHPYYAFGKKPGIEDKPLLRQVAGKERLFYSLLLLLLGFAILKRLFRKYFNDLFRLFFRTTLKHKQVREQLMQTPLPSLMLNGFYVLSAAFYICFLVQHYKADPNENFWLLFLYAGAALSAIYFLKFIGLKISGWVFGMQEAASSYVFIVFIINKMIGILLLPFLFILAFSTGTVYMVGLTLSWLVVGGLLVYRLILTWGAIKGQLQVNLFHFFLYLLAFEVAPLLLVYKALLLFFSQTA